MAAMRSKLLVPKKAKADAKGLERCYEFQWRSLELTVRIIQKGCAFYFTIVLGLFVYVVSHSVKAEVLENIMIFIVLVTVLVLVILLLLGCGIFAGAKQLRDTLAKIDEDAFHVSGMWKNFRRAFVVNTLASTLCLAILLLLVYFLVFRNGYVDLGKATSAVSAWFTNKFVALAQGL